MQFLIAYFLKHSSRVWKCEWTRGRGRWWKGKRTWTFAPKISCRFLILFLTKWIGKRSLGSSGIESIIVGWPVTVIEHFDYLVGCSMWLYLVQQAILIYDVDQSLSASYMVSRWIVIPPYVCVSCLENLYSPLKKMKNKCNTLMMLSIFIVINNERKDINKFQNSYNITLTIP